MYGVKLLKEELHIEVLGLKKNLEIIWAKGQIGAIPVFETKEDALDYVDGNEELIFELFLVSER